jgi:hypothetical protein
MGAKQLWVTAPGVTPPACYHAIRNLKTIAESSGRGTNYDLLECQKCGVRKQYRITESGHRTLVRAVAIRKAGSRPPPSATPVQSPWPPSSTATAKTSAGPVRTPSTPRTEPKLPLRDSAASSGQGSACARSPQGTASGAWRSDFEHETPSRGHRLQAEPARTLHRPHAP